MQGNGFLGDGESIRGSSVPAVQTLAGLTTGWAGRCWTDIARVDDDVRWLLKDLFDFKAGSEETDFHCQVWVI